MVKYALLKYRTPNLGDEIQSIAAKQFLPKINIMLNRDNINKTKIKENTKLILNGWFTHKPENWPIKNERIKPLFISFHISDKYGSSITKLTSEEALKYYKRHEPIGCRDLETLKILKKNGIKSYFSGCLTLTLKNKFTKRTDDIYIVDVDPSINKIIPSKVKRNIHFISHFAKGKIGRFWRAQRRLDKYARAKLVITSRLHCALPCLAFNTPVIFINKDLNDPRFKGLLKFLNSYTVDDLINQKVEINWDNPKQNPGNIEKIRKNLINRCNDFIKKDTFGNTPPLS